MTGYIKVDDLRDAGNNSIISSNGSGTFTYTFNAVSIARAALAADIIDGTKLADDAINSEHYTDGSIDTAHINDLNVTTAKIAADAITGAKIADDAIDSEHYAAGSIDTAHIANDQITAALIADNAIDSDMYVDGSIDTAHIADDQVTLAKMAGLARGKLIYGDSSGNPAALAVGSANQVLTADGTDVAWAAASGYDNTPSWGVEVGSNWGTSANTTTLMPASTELWDTDSAFTNTASNYKFTVPSGEAGKYLLHASTNIGGMSDGQDVHIYFYVNGSNSGVGMARYWVSQSGVGIYVTTLTIKALNVGDYVQVYTRHNQSSGQTDWQAAASFFGGFKLANV